MNILIERANLFMPGIVNCLRVLREYNPRFGVHWTSEPKDIVFGETKNYKVVVFKWVFCHSRRHSGDKNYGWLRVCYTKKSSVRKRVRKFNTQRILDNSFLGDEAFDYAGLEVLKDDKIKISWRNKQNQNHYKRLYCCDLSNLVLKNSNNL